MTSPVTRHSPSTKAQTPSQSPPPLPSWAPGAPLPPPPSLPKSAPSAADGSSEGSNAIVLPDDGSNGDAAPQAPLPSAQPPSAPPATTAPVKWDLRPEDALDEQIQDLEGWASAIIRRSRLEAARFWTLRAVAFCTAAAAAALSLRGFDRLPVALLALSGLTAAVEMGWLGDPLRNARRRATYQLRELQSSVKLRWQKVRLSHPDPGSRKRVAYAVELLEVIHQGQKEVASLLGDAEPNPGISRPT